VNPPPGFIRLAIPAGFAADFGAIFGKREGERFFYGFRVEDMHLNRLGFAHGGALATFADMQLAALMRMGRLAPKQSPTIRLSLDFLSPVRRGDWVQGEIALDRRTMQLAFAQTLLTAGETPVARAAAIYAHSDNAASLDAPPAPPPGVSDEPAPAGFEHRKPAPGFGALFGPTHWRTGTTRFGFRVAQRHINLFGLCHGGAMAMFADYQILPLRLAGLLEGGFAPTLSLSVDFLGPARLGDWIEAEASLVKRTGRYLFTAAVMSNPAGPVARSTAIYAAPHS